MSSRTARALKHHDVQRATTTKEPLLTAASSADATANATASASAKPPAPAKPNSHSTSSDAVIDSVPREKLVREAAYFRAECRGFTPGGELDDWIAAEREVDQQLTAGRIIPVGFYG